MFGYFSKTLTSDSNSVLLYILPVGLQGEENINNFVFGVIAASNSAALILKSLSMVASINTDSPSANFTISEYDTQYGVGMITSSPGFTKHIIAFAKDCFAPVDTTICEIS